MNLSQSPPNNPVEEALEAIPPILPASAVVEDAGNDAPHSRPRAHSLPGQERGVAEEEGAGLLHQPLGGLEGRVRGKGGDFCAGRGCRRHCKSDELSGRHHRHSIAFSEGEGPPGHHGHGHPHHHHRHEHRLSHHHEAHKLDHNPHPHHGHGFQHGAPPMHGHGHGHGHGFEGHRVRHGHGNLSHGPAQHHEGEEYHHPTDVGHHGCRAEDTLGDCNHHHHQAHGRGRSPHHTVETDEESDNDEDASRQSSSTEKEETLPTSDNRTKARGNSDPYEKQVKPDLTAVDRELHSLALRLARMMQSSRDLNVKDCHDLRLHGHHGHCGHHGHHGYHGHHGFGRHGHHPPPHHHAYSHSSHVPGHEHSSRHRHGLGMSPLHGFHSSNTQGCTHHHHGPSHDMHQGMEQQSFRERHRHNHVHFGTPMTAVTI